MCCLQVLAVTIQYCNNNHCGLLCSVKRYVSCKGIHSNNDIHLCFPPQMTDSTCQPIKQCIQTLGFLRLIHCWHTSIYHHWTNKFLPAIAVLWFDGGLVNRFPVFSGEVLQICQLLCPISNSHHPHSCTPNTVLWCHPTQVLCVPLSPALHVWTTRLVIRHTQNPAIFFLQRKYSFPPLMLKPVF